MFDCSDPVWQDDDFSSCFKRQYLLGLFPVLACLISFLLAAWQAAAASLDAPEAGGYSALDGIHEDDHTDGTAGPDSPEDEDEEEEAFEDEQTITTVSKPRGEIAILAVELLALLGQVAVHISILATRSHDKQSQSVQFARILVWLYILILGILRLLFTIRRADATPKLWYHATWLYSLQFVCSVFIFRGDVIRNMPTTHMALTSTDFALCLVLVIIAITVRRGNRVVTLVHDEKLPPSPEPMASLLSLAAFGWVDPLIYLGYKRTLEMPDVYDLDPRAKARRLVSDFRTIKSATRLTFRLFRFFKWDLLYQFWWTLFGASMQFGPTLLVKSILEYVQDPNSTSVHLVWLYVMAIPMFGFIQGIGDGFSLWRGREICIKIRALLVSEVYAKTLRRRTGVSDEAEKKDDAAAAEAPAEKSWREKILGVFRSDPPQKRPKHASSGTIINLMSVDAFKVSEICAYLHFLFPMVPVELAFAIGLLYRVLGWSSIASLVIMVILIPLNAWFTGRFTKAQKRILTCTDARISKTNEVLNNVRIVKFFAWEEKYINAVNEKRQDEIGAMRYRFRVYALASVFWSVTPLVITGFSFFLYTVVEGRPLYPSVAFTAISLFSLLRYPLDRLTDMIARVLEAKVSIDRVEAFLDEEETAKYKQLEPISPDEDVEDTFIGFKNATMSWGSSGDETENQPFQMINMKIRFAIGGLNIIAGPTGSGKTSLLMALLGEMNLLSGSVHLPGGYVREKLKPREDGLTDSVAYCAQQAWLVNDTIKQNIVFASPWNRARYEAVIEACALRKDLEVLESGDATLVGEKGIVVSGGQKQRISLARALYCNARFVLLDDCLSAVDSHTAQHIFDHCINGSMMKNRTCILVTHNISLTLAGAKHVVLLDNGKIKAQGTPEELRTNGVFRDALDSRPGSRAGTLPNSRPSSSSGHTAVQDGNGDANGAIDANGHANGNKPNGQVTQAKDDTSKAYQEDVKDANKRTESKSEGAVALSVIKLYFQAMGSWWFALGIVGGYIASSLSSISTNVWIRQWANAYQASESAFLTQDASNLSHTMAQQPLQSRTSTSLDNVWAMLSGRFMWIIPSASVKLQTSAMNSYGMANQEAKTPDAGYYLGIYVALGLVYVLLSLLQYLVLFGGSIRASKTLHARLLESVMRAKFKFFDTTPLGQIVNRFSKDMQSVDLDVAPVAAGVLSSLVGAITTVILITIVTPYFLIAAFFLAGMYVAIALFYINSSRDLKRLESANRSPLYQQFGETISGITTIRAYGDETRFIRDNAGRINTHNRPFIYLWATNRWLALRVQWAGALVSFFAAMFVLLSIGKLDAGAAGVSLSYALTFNDSILWLVRLYAENEQNMNHVERVKQYLEVEQEAAARIPERAPASSWPPKGSIEFEGYTTRYRSDLDPVLKNLSVKIEGEEKVGIVGRTGAGKSSLALALFRGLEADEGKIMVDGIDVSRIGLQDLREAITIVPQDPTLFTGTVRNNLDPFGLFTDDEILDALRKVHLIGTPSTTVSGMATPLPHKSPQDGTPPDQTPLLHPVDDPGSTATDYTAHITNFAPAVVEPLIATHDTPNLAPQDIQGLSVDDPNGLTKVLTNTRENANIFYNLSSPIAESGTNLSQGQRQLLCLARALLKNPRILVMDEATASIDYATDAKIQETLREVKGSTLITIAHRLKTIIDYDKVMVLDKGEVAEFGAPWDLIENEGGDFRGLCESSGELDTLLEAAARAKSAKR